MGAPVGAKTCGTMTTGEETDATDDDEEPSPQVLSLTTIEDDCGRMKSGEGGIRTPGGCYTTPVFKTGAFGHSATSPGSLSAVKSYLLFLHFSSACWRPIRCVNKLRGYPESVFCDKS